MSAYYSQADRTRQTGPVSNPVTEPREAPRKDGQTHQQANPARTPRKAHLRVARIDPLSTMKFSFIMSLVCFIVLFVAVAVLYGLLAMLGVFDAISTVITDLTSTEADGGVNAAAWFAPSRILGYAALTGAVNVILITGLATLWTVIYNLAAELVGGIQVTLSESE